MIFDFEDFLRNLGDPELLLVLHHVGQHSTSNEDLRGEMSDDRDTDHDENEE